MTSSPAVSGATTLSKDVCTRSFQGASTGRGLAAGAVAFLLIATYAAATLVHASLYADGANNLLQILTKRGFVVEWPDRAGVDYITQAPLIIGLHIGLHSMKTAVLLYSAGTLGAPVLIYLLALLLSRNEWHLPVVAAVVATIYPATFFMSVSESLTAYAVYLLIAVILASSRPLSMIRTVMLLLCCTTLPFLYETSVLFGPFLAVWCLSRFRHSDDAPIVRGALLAATLTGLIAGATATWAILHPVDLQAEQSAETLFGLWASHEFDAATLVLGGALALGLATKRSSIIAAGEGVFLGLGALLTAIGSAPPSASYTIRLAPTLVLVPIFGMLWKPSLLLKLRVGVLEMRRICYPIAALVIALAIQTSTLLWGWNNFVDMVQHQVYTSHGLVSYSRTRLDLVADYGWSSGYPSISRVFQESSRQGLVANPDPSHWQPFDPVKGTPSADNLYWRQ